MTPLVQLQSVSKEYGFQQIFNNLCLDIHQGEFILLIGENGTGKTSLLKLIASLARPNSGHLLFKGSKYQTYKHLLFRHIIMISHENRLYDELSAYENLQLFARLFQVENMDKKINHALETLRLQRASKTPVRHFSSGMRKRLALARLLLHRFDLLILDEPYSGLDPLSIQELQDYLIEFHQQGGSVLMVTHHFSKEQNFIDRLLVLKEGQITDFSDNFPQDFASLL